jgi:ABC-2 type transport system ATP-binding protein
MSEMALTATHVIVVGRGRLIADMPMAQLIAQASSNIVVVRAPKARRLAQDLAGPDVVVDQQAPDLLEVTGLTAAQIGQRAYELDVALHELAPRAASLEQAFMDVTQDDVEFHANASGSAA